MPTASDGLLSTMADRTLPIWSKAGDRPDAKAVANLLRFDNGEVATASRLPESKVRLTGRIPPALKKHLVEWAVLLELVAGFFAGDEKKTAVWFNTPNNQLGGLEPRQYILFGRARKLREIILQALSENEP